MMQRRSFLQKAALSAAALSTTSVSAHGFNSLENANNKRLDGLKLSLAQWSLHRQFFNGNLHPENFASIAINTYDINAVEYVNQFYTDSGEDEKFWIGMKERAENSEKLRI